MFKNRFLKNYSAAMCGFTTQASSDIIVDSKLVKP